MVNKLIPMAGAGSRFAMKGYETPKPLLPVMGKPMVVSAARDLPGPDENFIFVMRDTHIAEYGIDQVLNSHFPGNRQVVIDRLTEGQASTCLMARDLIYNDDQLIIGASDNGMIYNNSEFEELKKTADALVFTFRGNPTVVPNPKAYGWCVVGEDGLTITEAKVKYNMPDAINNHAYVGAFWFRTGKLFVDAAERMINQDRRVNGEFYVDECINDVIQMGFTAKVFEMKHYICWGTPNDYKTFTYWHDYYQLKKSGKPYVVNRPALL
jgi:dTDP-glucose pyrophosphorylase